MKIAALTDIGSCRQENQDNYCARQLVDGTGWGLVCDGMGGANGGRVASTLATQTMLRYFDHSLRTIENGEEKAFMMRAFDNANRAVYEKATSDPEVLGMGTTGVCALQRGNLAHIVHAGDSRAYLWHPPADAGSFHGAAAGGQRADHPRTGRPASAEKSDYTCPWRFGQYCAGI